MSFKRISELNRFYMIVIPVIGVATLLVGLFFVSQTRNWITALITMLAGVGTVAGIYLIHRWYLFRPRIASTTLYAGILIALIPAGLFAYLYTTGALLTLVEPREEAPIPEGVGPAEVNATIKILTIYDADITGMMEIQLWETYDKYNSSTWLQVDLSSNWSSTEFYHVDADGGWLNADMFNINLTPYDEVNHSLNYYVRLRAWHMLSEWQNGSYSSPAWWYFGQWIEGNGHPNESIPFIEENETGITWVRVWNGENVVRDYVSEPSNVYFSIEDVLTLQDWDSSDGAYPNNHSANYRIRINIPSNETIRAFKEQYDWLTEQWYGAWLIASSNETLNINRNYTDLFGNDLLTWVNVTDGPTYRGVIFNNSLTSWATYDVAILLPTFYSNNEWLADISIWNGSSGINWWFGVGLENNIQIMTSI